MLFTSWCKWLLICNWYTEYWYKYKSTVCNASLCIKYEQVYDRYVFWSNFKNKYIYMIDIDM